MLNKRIVLGSLIAGAFLLPAVAGAGVVTGVCSNCHTMHGSQDGIPAASLNNTLLKTGGTCVGCHTGNGANNASSGKATVGTMQVPQVDDASGATTLSGGYFDTTAAMDAHQHNIADLNMGVDPMYSVGVVEYSPGGIAGSRLALNDGSGNPVLGCAGCHGGSGGHHGASSTSYRMLTGVAAGTPDVNFGVGFQRHLNSYNAAAMNGFCATCHSDFHTTQGVGLAGDSTSAWTRHPTGITLAAADADNTAGGVSNYSYVANYGAGAAGTTDNLPLGSGGEILCLTCHAPHGTANNDLLTFNYSTVVAGGDTDNGGCETCHGYGVNGANGM